MPGLSNVGQPSNTTYKMKDAARSEGARWERKAVRAYLRRRLLKDRLTQPAKSIVEEILKWVLTRQARYDKKKGGL